MAMPTRDIKAHTRGRQKNFLQDTARDNPILFHKGELGSIPEGCGTNLAQYTEIGTTSVAHKGYPKKPEYITFEPYEKSKINWRSTGGPVLEPMRFPRRQQISETRNKPTV